MGAWKRRFHCGTSIEMGERHDEVQIMRKVSGGSYNVTTSLPLNHCQLCRCFHNSADQPRRAASNETPTRENDEALSKSRLEQFIGACSGNHSNKRNSF